MAAKHSAGPRPASHHSPRALSRCYTLPAGRPSASCQTREGVAGSGYGSYTGHLVTASGYAPHPAASWRLDAPSRVGRSRFMAAPCGSGPRVSSPPTLVIGGFPGVIGSEIGFMADFYGKMTENPRFPAIFGSNRVKSRSNRVKSGQKSVKSGHRY